MSATAEDLYDVPDLYDAQYRTYREDLAFYRRLVEDHGGPVLELGCGTGRVTVELARTGAQVDAIDVSSRMLERARDRVRAANVGDLVTCYQADMRSLDASVNAAPGYRLALAPFNTLMHAYAVEDQDRTLSGAFERLAPGGRFACDVYVPRFGAMGVLRAEPMWQRALGDDVDLMLIQDHDPAGQRLVSTYLVDRTDAEGVVRRQRVRLTQRYYTRFELERALRQAGFERVRIFGSFERAPFREDSDVMVAVGRKPREA